MKRRTPIQAFTLAATVALCPLVAAGPATAQSGAASVRVVAAPADVGASETVRGLGTFVTHRYPLAEVPRSALPMSMAALPLRPANTPVNQAGIVVYRDRATGKLYDHPVVQSATIMGWLASYEKTRDRRFLEAATRNGAHVLEYAEASRGALYYPYPFDFALHGKAASTMDAPWYSSMAQGQMLSALVRLHQVTGEQRWKDAADATFSSFTKPRTARGPWTVDIDRDGMLWFEEYASGNQVDRAFNGHNFALFGVYEYWLATKDPTAEKVLQGGLAAAMHHASDIRRPGERSRYCLEHEVQDAKYHRIHISQLANLAKISADVRFSRLADAFLADAPGAYLGGTGRLAWGTHTALSRDSRGDVTSRSSVSPRRATTVNYDRRESIPGRTGVWLRIASGPYADRWVQERRGRAFVNGSLDAIAYTPQRTLKLAAGTTYAYRVSADGKVTVARTLRLSRTSSAPVSMSVTADGARYARVTAGPLSGLYVATGSRASVV